MRVYNGSLLRHAQFLVTAVVGMGRLRMRYRVYRYCIRVGLPHIFKTRYGPDARSESLLFVLLAEVSADKSDVVAKVANLEWWCLALLAVVVGLVSCFAFWHTRVDFDLTRC